MKTTKLSALRILCIRVVSHIGIAYIVTIIGHFIAMAEKTLSKRNVLRERR